MSEEEKAKLKQMLQTRFRYYCTSGGRLTQEQQNELADRLTEDLITNEWETLKAHLEYDKAQGFYNSKAMWEMLKRANDRLFPNTNQKGIFDIYPIPDAIVHALLDTV